MTRLAASVLMLAMPPQHHLHDARQGGWARLRQADADQLRWLGAQGGPGRWQLAVLNGLFDVDTEGQTIRVGGQAIGPYWEVLALHYLSIRLRPDPLPPEVAFADLASGRTYATVYHQRVVRRLCATVGRDEGQLRQAADRLGGHRIQPPGFAFDLVVFPRVTARLIWHAGDEEFEPSATLLFARNIELFFCAEDVVVLSERLVSRLCGRPW